MLQNREVVKKAEDRCNETVERYLPQKRRFENLRKLGIAIGVIFCIKPRISPKQRYDVSLDFGFPLFCGNSDMVFR